MTAPRKTSGEHRPSAILSQEANSKIFSLLGSRAQALGTAVVAIMAADPPKYSDWKEVLMAVVTFTKDYVRKAYYVQVYDLVGWQRVEEVEVAKGTPYHVLAPLFHQFPAQKKMMGLKFSSEVDAKAFAEAVRVLVGTGTLRKPEGRPPPSPRELAAPSQLLQEQQQALEAYRQDGEQQQTQAQQQPQQQSQPQRRGLASFSLPMQPLDKPTTLDRRRSSKKITKDMIGYPTNFQHLQHIGFNSEHVKIDEREQQVIFRGDADSPRRPAPPPPPARHKASSNTPFEASPAVSDSSEASASAEPSPSAGNLGSGSPPSSESRFFNEVENPSSSVDASTTPSGEAVLASLPPSSCQEPSLASNDPSSAEHSIHDINMEAVATTKSTGTVNSTNANHQDQNMCTVCTDQLPSGFPEEVESPCVFRDSTGPNSSPSSDKSYVSLIVGEHNSSADPTEPSDPAYAKPEDSSTIISAPSEPSLTTSLTRTDPSLISTFTYSQTPSTPDITTTSTQLISAPTPTTASIASTEPSFTVSSNVELSSPSTSVTTPGPPPSTTDITQGLDPSTTAIAPESAPAITTTTQGPVPSTTTTTLWPTLSTTTSPSTITTNLEPASSTANITGPVPSITTTPEQGLSTITTTPGQVPSTTTTAPEPAPSASPNTEPSYSGAACTNAHPCPTFTSAVLCSAASGTAPAASSSTAAGAPGAIGAVSPPTPPPPRLRKRSSFRPSPNTPPPPPPP